jgi:hypothetical protein
LRLLSLPEEIKQGLMARRISEGHTRPLLMLIDRPAEQTTLYKEIMVKKMSVRDAEKVARKIAQDKVRKKQFVVDPVIRDFEKKLAENLGTRVHIEPKEKGGQITIDYFTIKDLESILSSMQKVEREQSMMESFLTGQRNVAAEEKITKTTGVSFSTPVVAESQPITKSGASINLPEVHREELPAYTHRANSDLVVADKVLETRHNRINKLTTEKVHKDERKKTVTESLIEGTQVSGPKDSLESILEGLENNLISEKTRIDVVVEDIPKKIIEPVITEPTPMSEVNLEADQIPESSIEFHDSFKTTANSGEHILNTGGLVRESEPLVTQEESTDLSQSQPHYREESELASVPLQEEVYSAPIRGRAQEQRYIPQQEQGNENTQPYQTQNNGQHVQPQGQQQYVPQNQVHYQQAPTRKKSLFQRFFG